MISYLSLLRKRRWFKRAMKEFSSNSWQYKKLDGLQFLMKLMVNMGYG